MKRFRVEKYLGREIRQRQTLVKEASVGQLIQDSKDRIIAERMS